MLTTSSKKKIWNPNKCKKEIDIYRFLFKLYFIEPRVQSIIFEKSSVQACLSHTEIIIEIL